MDRPGIAESQTKASLRDGQDAGELLLDIEARIGELLPSAKEAMGQSSQKRGVPKGKARPAPAILPDGISSKKAHQARTIKDNPEVVVKIKAQARENEDIPTLIKTGPLAAAGSQVASHQIPS